MFGVMIIRCVSVEQPGGLDLRRAPWSHGTLEDHLAEMSHFIAAPERLRPARRAVRVAAAHWLCRGCGSPRLHQWNGVLARSVSRRYLRRARGSP